MTQQPAVQEIPTRGAGLQCLQYQQQQRHHLLPNLLQTHRQNQKVNKDFDPRHDRYHADHHKTNETYTN